MLSRPGSREAHWRDVRMTQLREDVDPVPLRPRRGHVPERGTGGAHGGPSTAAAMGCSCRTRSCSRAWCRSGVPWQPGLSESGRLGGHADTEIMAGRCDGSHGHGASPLDNPPPARVLQAVRDAGARKTRGNQHSPRIGRLRIPQIGVAARRQARPSGAASGRMAAVINLRRRSRQRRAARRNARPPGGAAPGCRRRARRRQCR